MLELDQDFERGYVPAKLPLIKKPILVICAPRSGSTTCAEIMQLDMDLDVGHEKMGADGIVYCHWAVPRLERDPSHELATIQRQDYEFAKVVHLMRAPLSCIESLQREMQAQYWTWQELHTGIEINIEDGDRPTYEQVARFWCCWYDMCQIQSSETWYLEKLAADNGTWLNGGHFKKRPIWYEDLGEMEGEVKDRARANGYL